MKSSEEGRDGARSGLGRWQGLPTHARNRIAVPRGIVEGHPAARSGASVKALLDHFLLRSPVRSHTFYF